MAGTWYPAGDSECADMVLACLDKGLESPVPDPKVIVAPHAGFVFSGEIAGSAFRTLANHRERIKRVVIIGPAHRAGFKGLATTSADAWATPLGTVPVDWGALRKLMPLPGFSVLDKVFEGEHSLEAHLPFLQPVLDDFTIVPILVGDASVELVREALSLVWGGKRARATALAVTGRWPGLWSWRGPPISGSPISMFAIPAIPEVAATGWSATAPMRWNTLKTPGFPTPIAGNCWGLPDRRCNLESKIAGRRR